MNILNTINEIYKKFNISELNTILELAVRLRGHETYNTMRISDTELLKGLEEILEISKEDFLEKKLVVRKVQ